MSGLLISDSLLKLSIVIFWYTVHFGNTPNFLLQCYCSFLLLPFKTSHHLYFSFLEPVSFNYGSLILTAATTFVVNFLTPEGFLTPRPYLSRYNLISLYYQCQTQTLFRKLSLPNTGHDLELSMLNQT